MTNEMLVSEAKYQSSMLMFRNLMNDGVISNEDYIAAEKILKEKYTPHFGALFFDLSLT